MNKTVVALGALVAASVALAACGGGAGGSTSPLPGSPSSNSGGATAQSSQAVTASSGGTLSAAIGGVKTTITIPAGALAANSTVTLTVYSNSASLPHPYSGSFEGAFAIEDGGTPLRAPLTVTLTSSSGATAGSLLLYSKQSGTYTVVDSTTTSSGTLTNQNATGYVGISSANGQAYVFSSNPAPSRPAPLVLTIAGASPAPYVIGTSAGFTVSGADANGNPYLFTPSFSLDNSAVGTIASSATNPNAATVTFGTAQATGNVVVTDKRTGTVGKLQISVLSQRPANNGDTYKYAGTLTQTFDNTLQTPSPGSSPIPVSNTTANVTQSILVKSGQNYQGQSGLYDFALTETDTTPLNATTSTSDSYYGFGANGTSELEYGSQWADQSGDTLSTSYPTPLIIDELPETSGQQWSNSAAASLYDNISNGSNGPALTSHRVYNADGTYTETTLYPPGYIGAGTAQSTITQNADGSGTYAVPANATTNDFFNVVTYSSPEPVPSSTPMITVGVFDNPNPAPGTPPDVTIQVPLWYPTTPVFYSEKDVDNGVQPLPQSCNVPSAFGTHAMQLVQTVNRLDTILGFTDAQTTTSYVVNGFGPVCIQLKDVENDYYDFTEFSNNGTLIWPTSTTAPFQRTTMVETLTLQQNGTNVIGTMKSQSATRTFTTALLHAARGPFASAVEHARVAHERAFAQAAKRLIRKHGGQ